MNYAPSTDQKAMDIERFVEAPGRKELVEQVRKKIETYSYALALELTLKAHWRGWRVAEVPTTWRDRTAASAAKLGRLNGFGESIPYSLFTPSTSFGVNKSGPNVAGK